MIHNMTSWNVMSPMITICLNLLQETSLSLAERENTSNQNVVLVWDKSFDSLLKRFISFHREPTSLQGRI